MDQRSTHRSRDNNLTIKVEKKRSQAISNRDDSQGSKTSRNNEQRNEQSLKNQDLLEIVHKKSKSKALRKSVVIGQNTQVMSGSIDLSKTLQPTTPASPDYSRRLSVKDNQDFGATAGKEAAKYEVIKLHETPKREEDKAAVGKGSAEKHLRK